MAAKKSYGYANSPKPKGAFETYHPDRTAYPKLRMDAKEYLVQMIMQLEKVNRVTAERKAEERLRSAEKGDCGCPRR